MGILLRNPYTCLIPFAKSSKISNILSNLSLSRIVPNDYGQ